MNILKNHSLKNLNTFGIDVKGAYFTEVNSTHELVSLLADTAYRALSKLVLGSGSNILFTMDYNGLVIHNRILGIEIISQNDESVKIAAAGGENWHDLVEYSLINNFGGIENLSLIPGTAGAAPIQNIGAYGVEIKDVLTAVEAVNLENGDKKIFTNNECQFGYRNSIFKSTYRDKYLVSKIILKLSKKPVVNTSYGAIREVLNTKGIINPGIRDVSNAVIHIRRSKLPDPAEIGNAGSFFKNPVVDQIDFEGLKLTYPDIPGYRDGQLVKVPAAWLIESCGWKGFKRGQVGVHSKQPLVLVNYGDGTGLELKNLADQVKESVADKFGIDLEVEPRIF